MAVEAMQREYIYHLDGTKGGNAESATKGKSNTTQIMYDDIDELDELQLSSLVKKQDSPSVTFPPFFHNDLHDLESLWWISVWELFFFRDKSEPESDERALERQLVTEELFPRTMDVIVRLPFVKAERRFLDKTAWFPGSFGGLKDALNRLRRNMLMHYNGYEEIFPDIKEETVEGLHEDFRVNFHICRKFARNIEIVPVKTTGMRRVGAEPGPDIQPSQNEAPLNAVSPNIGIPPTPNAVLEEPSAASGTEGTKVGPTTTPSSSGSTHGSKRKADEDNGDDMIYPQPQPRVAT